MSRPDKTRRRRSEPSLRDRLTAVGDPPPAPVATDAGVESGASSDEPRAEPTATTPDLPTTPRRAPRIGPHAAIAAHRARRTWIALLFFPFFAIYLAIDAMREFRDLLARSRKQQVEQRAPFSRPEEMGPIEDRSMADVVAAIERFPFRPAKVSTSHAFFRDNGADAIGALLSPNPQISTVPHFYPPYFEQRLFRGTDGVQLAGMQAMHDQPAPAVVICHGLLMTKNFDMIIQLARRAYEQWGFHVVTLDLRGWGQSAWTTDAPSSASYYEGRDVLEVARELQRNELVTSVAGVGFSLGGATMLNAAHASSASADRPLDGGVVAISAPTDISSALRHISTKPGFRDPYFGLWHVFRAAIKGNVRRNGLRRDLTTWYDLVEEVSVPFYGVDMDEFCSRGSAVNWAHEIDQPVLELHAGDDFLVPVQHAYALQDAAGGNPWVHVMVRDSGNHCSFAAVDSSWYHSTIRRWLEYWATPGMPAGPADAPLD
jgi:predicted alpha/beta-fold hydrolase